MNEESGPEDEAEKGDGAKKVKTERWVADGEVHAFDWPARSSQRVIKRERETEDKQLGAGKEPKASKFTPIQTTAFDCYDFNDLIRNNQSRMKAESGQKDDDHSRIVAPDEADSDGRRRRALTTRT